MTKIALITGGSSGIGKAIGTLFQANGYTIVVADKDPAPYADDFHAIDFSDPSRTEAVIPYIKERFGAPDVLINNVGGGGFGDLLHTSTEDFIRVLHVNLTTAFVLSRDFARAFGADRSRPGRIINIASTRAHMSERNTEAYSASKGGIVSLTHALAISLSDTRITVNCISPGWIQCSGYEALTEEDHRQHPSGRVGRPEDIARACLFLCDPANDFINGQELVIDGGMTKKMIYV
jgi:NAD(P)-dependent dehydrogenase (short-subunit alcohol dehydrogenase family)